MRVSGWREQKADGLIMNQGYIADVQKREPDNDELMQQVQYGYKYKSKYSEASA